MIDDDNTRKQEFKRDLWDLSPLEITRKHIVFGECAVISAEKYYELRNCISEQFGIHTNQVIVVGSGKLGFSIAPGKMYRDFGDTSDIDVAIVSENLFLSVWKDVHRYFDQGGYWEKKSEFVSYLFRGWIRPDKLPPDQHFEFSRVWAEFFDALSASRRFSNARVAGAIYQSWYFLESYQSIAVAECAKSIDRATGRENED